MSQHGLDPTYVKVRRNHRIVSVAVIVAVGKITDWRTAIDQAYTLRDLADVGASRVMNSPRQCGQVASTGRDGSLH